MSERNDNEKTSFEKTLHEAVNFTSDAAFEFCAKVAEIVGTGVISGNADSVAGYRQACADIAARIRDQKGRRP